MTSFKTRVIGAVILVSLAIIFVPMLFKSPSAPPAQPVASDGGASGERPLRNQSSETGSESRFSQRLEVPDAPDIPEFTIEQAVEPELRDRKVEADASEIGGGQSSADRVDPASTKRPTVSTDSSTSARSPSSPPASSPAEPAKTAPQPVVKPAPKPADGGSAAPAAAKPDANSVGDKSRFGEAWTIQIGAFSDRSRAQKISTELQQTGTAAYLQDIKTASGVDMVRVYAGPMLARDSAEKLKSTLDSKYGVNSLIMRYRPVQP